MNSMRKAQKIIRPEAILEWGRGGCVGPKKQEKTVLPRSERQEEILVRILTVLLIPIIIPLFLIIGCFLTFVIVGAIYVGPLLGHMVMALLWPLLKTLRIPDAFAEKIQIGVFVITCSLGVCLMLGTIWR